MPAPPPNSIHPKSRTEWRKWLEENHPCAEGVWLISYKKAVGKPRFDYAEAVEEALCFRWIDSRASKLDEERSVPWFAPRKAKTGWSKPNKERLEKLIRAGRMAPAGLAKIEAAQEYFDAFPPSVKKAIFEWIASAKNLKLARNASKKQSRKPSRISVPISRANNYRREMDQFGIIKRHEIPVLIARVDSFGQVTLGNHLFLRKSIDEHKCRIEGN